MYSSTLSLTSKLDGGGWSTPRPQPLYPREKPETRCTEGWVGRKDGVDGCGKSQPPPGFDPRTVQPVASRYTGPPTDDTCMKLKEVRVCGAIFSFSYVRLRNPLTVAQHAGSHCARCSLFISVSGQSKFHFTATFYWQRFF